MAFHPCLSSTAFAQFDLLELQALFATQRTWCQPAPLVCPERVQAMSRQGSLTTSMRAEYRAALERLGALEKRYWQPASAGEKELHRIARWILDRWTDKNRVLLQVPWPVGWHGLSL
jgi:hypothetical protein